MKKKIIRCTNCCFKSVCRQISLIYQSLVILFFSNNSLVICWVLTQILCFWWSWNRDTILQLWRDFLDRIWRKLMEAKSQHDFGISVQYSTVYELYCCTIMANFYTILPVSEQYISPLWPICWVSLVNLMETKGGNFKGI